MTPPVFAYRLTTHGEAFFPRRYEDMLLRLLDQVAQRDGREAVASLLESQFDAMADRHAPMIAHATTDERMEHVTQALSTKGSWPRGIARPMARQLLPTTARFWPSPSVSGGV